MKCTGLNVFSGDPIEVTFGETITSVDDLIDPHNNPGIYIAPGFVDLQVNGFAGADYNSPETPLELICHSLQAMFATGVTRLYPTIITGSEERITGSLRNLLKAKQTLP